VVDLACTIRGRLNVWLAPADLIDGSNARLYLESPERPGTLLVGLNHREKKWHDVWSIDIATAERKLVLENTGQFRSFNFDWQLNPRLARRATPDRGGSCRCWLIGGKAESWCAKYCKISSTHL
jgi:hypothetical protein